MIRELDYIVLTVALAAQRLQAGDIGTVMMVHEDGRGFEVEFLTLEGETIAVLTLDALQVRPVRHGEIAHVRPLEAAG